MLHACAVLVLRWFVSHMHCCSVVLSEHCGVCHFGFLWIGPVCLCCRTLARAIIPYNDHVVQLVSSLRLDIFLHALCRTQRCIRGCTIG